MDNAKKLIVIDGNSLLFRAFYATSYGDPSSIMRTKDGIPTNAIFAFANMVSKIMQSFKGGESIFIGFDTDSQTFRKEEFADYKANRKPAPPELIPQFPISREFLDALNVIHYEAHGVEADDICGTIAKMAGKQGYEVMVYTSDKDYLQLVDDHITVNLIKKGLSDINPITPASMMEQYGFTPLQIIDYKGLRGDSSDNLPGIPGVGEKGAVKLISEYGSFDEIIAAAKDGRIKGKIGENIVAGEEMGRRCYSLATMKLDVPLPFGLEDLLYKGYAYDEISAFCKKYELRQFLSRLPASLKGGDTSASAPETKTVSSLEGIAMPSRIGVALDFDGSSYQADAPYGLAISTGDATYYLAIDDLKNDAKAKEILKNPSISKSVYDAKMLIVVLAKYGIDIRGIEFDLLLAAYLLDSSLTGDKRLAYACFGVDIAPSSGSLSLFAVGSPEQAGKMAYYAKELQNKALSQMEQESCGKLYQEIELPLSFVLAEMEKEGFPLDGKTLEEIGAGFREKRDELEAEIVTLAGHPINPASPKQVGELLFNELQLASSKSMSTSVEVLKSLEDKHPIVGKILEYRKYAKLVGTYIDGLLPHIQDDGKIHTCFNQAQTTTGRLSSSSPNLQNISTRDEESRLIRQAFFYPNPQTKILSLDYSQIELRILASMSHCQKYIDVFNAGHDVHSETARAIFGVPEGQEVPHDLRRRAKAVNFAIIYGTTPFGLADQIGTTPTEASRIIRSFYAAYPEIDAFLSQITKDVEAQGYVVTMFGRRRYLREINDPNYAKREAARRAALNAPVQGSAADLIKIAMLKVASFLKEGGYKSKMVLQIHDELLFALDASEEEILVPKIKEIMEHAIELPVALQVEGNVGNTWYDAKD